MNGITNATARRYLLLLLIAATCVGSCAELTIKRPDAGAFGWQELRVSSGELQTAFIVAPDPVKEVILADQRGDKAAVEGLSKKLPKSAWAYGIILRGNGPEYGVNEVNLFEPFPCGDLLRVHSGKIELDRQRRIAKISLRVVQGDTVTDFIGNGTYRIALEPGTRP